MKNPYSRKVFFTSLLISFVSTLELWLSILESNKYRTLSKVLGYAQTVIIAPIEVTFFATNSYMAGFIFLIAGPVIVFAEWFIILYILTLLYARFIKKNTLTEVDHSQEVPVHQEVKKQHWILLVVCLLVAIRSAFTQTAYRNEVRKAESPTPSKTTSSTAGAKKNNSVNDAGDHKAYWVSENSVYYKNLEVTGADVATFQELTNGWAKDKKAVYLEGQKQDYLDAATVKVFPHVYVVDKAAVWVYGTDYYLRADKTNADPATFSVISHGYGKDKNGVYYFAQKIVNADIRSFTLLRDSSYPSSEGLASNWYAKDKNNVYYRSDVIKNADVQSFKYLGDEYAKDKNRVYYGGRMLAIEVDPASFAIVGGGAIKDSKRVYFRNYNEDTYKLVADVDAPSFQYVGVCGSLEASAGRYFKDKNHVFTQNYSVGNPVKPVSYIDVLSFHYFGNHGVAQGMPYSVSYAKDKNNVYRSCGAILDGADVATFEDLKDGYARSKNKVWYLEDLISGADTASFESLGAGYAKDKARVYFAGKTIQNADVASFMLVIEYTADNKYSVVYAKDKNHVYSGSNIVEGVNPESCTTESIGNCNPGESNL